MNKNDLSDKAAAIELRRRINSYREGNDNLTFVDGWQECRRRAEAQMQELKEIKEKYLGLLEDIKKIGFTTDGR